MVDWERIAMYLLGADVGGTFTDLVLTDTEAAQTTIHKVPSTPDDPSQAVIDGAVDICELAGIASAQVAQIYHGTTVATNAALQYRGSVAGMITTEGFRDIVHIGRHQRPQHYSIQQQIPWQARPLVKRRHRKVVAGRVAPPDGSELIPLDEDAVARAARELRDAGVEAIAICFLFSYLNPSHEQRAKELVKAAAPDLFVTCSHEVSPQFREFERFTTTAMNAFIGPLVSAYVNRLADKLRGRGFDAEFHIMRSNGGVASPAIITELPVLTLLSGLAAGVLGALRVGQLVDRNNIISLDIGGTSADIGVVSGGVCGEASARDTQIADYPMLIPMLDLHTIGAGGGSIAYIDEAGAFKVGPVSAGAVPGPAAYGHGGTLPTVTDANLFLGRLDPDNFLGGNMRLDAAAAHQVIIELASALGLASDEMAEGVIALLNANMANAIRARTVQKGIDPREYALVAAGGAGPLHAAEVAKLLSIPEVIVPPHPGINSAEGLLTTDLKYEVVRTAFITSTDGTPVRLKEVLSEIRAELENQLRGEGIDPSMAGFEASTDARYVGQGYELKLPLTAELLAADDFLTYVESFHSVHQREYGHSFEASPVEFVNLRVTALVPVPKIAEPACPSGEDLAAALVRESEAMFRIDETLSAYKTAFYNREKLPVNKSFRGPAVILQTDSTVVVPPDCSAMLTSSDVIIISIPETLS